MNPDFFTIIPARYDSSRLPGKPLVDIAGKPMVQHVYDRAVEAGSSEIVIATDDERIFNVVTAFGGKVVMTSGDHESGTDRLAEVVTQLGWADDTVVVNLQGDEPLMDPDLLRLVANNLHQHDEVGLTTLATPILQREEIFNPNAVKVVCDSAGKALYFSRAPIPWVRGNYDVSDSSALPDTTQPLRHLGIYAYRASVLKQITKYPPCEIELAESLEQLRALWNGINIHVGIIDQVPGHGVDTEEDLELVRLAMS
ncbi:MAG TPA: 3-deoxy-manno-octulosonate cytidylyltransferase [Gammaproteobacteria bacterium]|jgi:3-deoxy-manno-octulosonate cytidylyltransferase (CMP-KDO synthetase)|nr:3-deoxy-manno-octulosonate cytidylyltransferase [Gammaproteobacteria bacterium]